MKEEIVKLLMGEFASVYCDNCVGNEEHCDECHRKAMNWSLSQSGATEVADKIIEIFER